MRKKPKVTSHENGVCKVEPEEVGSENVEEADIDYEVSCFVIY